MSQSFDEVRNLTQQQLMVATELAGSYTQTEVSERMGISRATITRWMRLPLFKRAVTRAQKGEDLLALLETEQIRKIRGDEDYSGDVKVLLSELVNKSQDLTVIGANCLIKAANAIQRSYKAIEKGEEKAWTVREAVVVGEFGLKCQREAIALWEHSLGIEALAAEMEKRNAS